MFRQTFKSVEYTDINDEWAIRNLDILTDVCHSAKTQVVPQATEETASPETPSASMSASDVNPRPCLCP